METINPSALLVSQVFNNWAIGISALIAAGGGLKVYFDWAHNAREKRKREKLTTELKAKFPPENNGKTFELIESSAKPGKIYLLNKVTNKKHHIASWLTFQTLGYEYEMVKRLGQEVFKSIKEGERILIEE